MKSKALSRSSQPNATVTQYIIGVWFKYNWDTFFHVIGIYYAGSVRDSFQWWTDAALGTYFLSRSGLVASSLPTRSLAPGFSATSS